MYSCCSVLVYFYNFRWNDYGVASLTSVLDMVKVMSFAIQEGKIAVHCHAGLGRTGIVLFCMFTICFNESGAVAASLFWVMWLIGLSTVRLLAAISYHYCVLKQDTKPQVTPEGLSR